MNPEIESDAANGNSVPADPLTDLERRNADLKRRNTELEEKLTELDQHIRDALE